MNLSGLAMPTVFLLAAEYHALGVALFVGVYVLLLVWLCLMPERLLDEPPGRPWWQSSRLWAIMITIVQILVYLALR